MGGAVALLLHKKDPSFWNGAVLVALMCKISEKLKPHPVVVNISYIRAFKDPVKRELVRTSTVSDFSLSNVSDLHFTVSGT
ncbi:hypothetical protein V6N13_004732 [Hibiscus sabdariffa]|uniref:Uncharacterized protein n=1 Tax=Hibiscus sabdariffa TaxID=183260 RepID=A0ABR2S078_9ROSI